MKYPETNPLTPKTVAIVQARMTSSRLPGKVLLEIAGRPMLAHVVDRASQARSVHQVVVACTTNGADDPIASFCAQAGVACFRGSEHDVLDRFYQAARQFQAQVVVRLTADCPLLDPQVVDRTVQALTAGVDFAANRLPPPWKRTYPIGLDVEVCTFTALERAWQEAGELYQREHVMPYLYEQEGRFKVRVVDHDPDYGSLRWTVDTAEDLALVRRIFAHFAPRRDFSWLEVIELVRSHPELFAINADIQHKSAFDVDARAKASSRKRSR